MSAGTDALAEAARMESALIYGTTCREAKRLRQDQKAYDEANLARALQSQEMSAPRRYASGPDSTAGIAAALRRGLSTSEIVGALCVDYATVRNVRKRLMAKGAA